jgi:hypothetical protein
MHARMVHDPNELTAGGASDGDGDGRMPPPGKGRDRPNSEQARRTLGIMARTWRCTTTTCLRARSHAVEAQAAARTCGIPPHAAVSGSSNAINAATVTSPAA